MSRLGILFIFLSSLLVEADCASLTPFVPVTIRLASNSTVDFAVANNTDMNVHDSGLWLLATHTQSVPLHVSIDWQFKANASDTGLVLSSRPSNVSLFNPSTSSVDAMIVLREYSRSAPIPGLCSNTTQKSPLVQTVFDYDTIKVSFGSAGNYNESCVESRAKLTYSVYHLFLEEQNLNQQYLIRNLADAVDKGVLGTRVDNELVRRQGDHFIVTFTSVPGVASIFSVVVTDNENNTSVAYASAVTYGCHLKEDGSNGPSCNNPNHILTRILYVPLLASGIFLAFVGQRYFRCSLFVLGLISGSLISFVCLFSPQYSYLVTLLTSIAFGILFSSFWVLLWHSLRVAVFTVLLSTLTLGVFISSSILYLPFVHAPVLASDFNYWLTLTAIAMIPSVALLSFTKSAHILSCAVVGAYMVVLPLDHYWGSSLKYIVVDVIRRATVPGFSQAVLDHPFQTHDIVLSWLLVALALAGLLTQLLREKHRPGLTTERSRLDPYERENAANEQRVPLLYDEEAMRETMREAAIAAINAAVGRTANIGVVEPSSGAESGDPSAPPMSAGRSIPSHSRSGTQSMVTVTPRRRDVVLPKQSELMQRRNRDIFKPPSPDTEGLA